MKKKVIIFTILTIIVLICTLNSSLFAQKNEQNSNICLWKIESDSNTIYILGSIHFLKEDNYPLDEKYNDVFKDIENIVFEIHFDSTQSPKFQQYTMSQAFYQKGKTFKDEVSDSTYSLLKSKLKDVGIQIEKLNAFKPWFIGLTLMSTKLQEFGFKPEFGVDKHFFNRAKEMNKNIMGLEEPKFQLDLLTTLPGDDQEAFIFQTLEQYEEIGNSLDQIVAAWEKGDLNKLDSLFNKSMESYPKLHETIIIQRNLNWIEPIENFINDNEDYLIIVGSAHLSGEKGVINLLKAKGYKIKQL